QQPGRSYVAVDGQSRFATLRRNHQAHLALGGATSTPTSLARPMAAWMRPDARASSMKRLIVASDAASPLATTMDCSTPKKFSSRTRTLGACAAASERRCLLAP